MARRASVRALLVLASGLLALGVLVLPGAPVARAGTVYMTGSVPHGIIAVSAGRQYDLVDVPGVAGGTVLWSLTIGAGGGAFTLGTTCSDGVGGVMGSPIPYDAHGVMSNGFGAALYVFPGNYSAASRTVGSAGGAYPSCSVVVTSSATTSIEFSGSWEVDYAASGPPQPSNNNTQTSSNAPTVAPSASASTSPAPSPSAAPTTGALPSGTCWSYPSGTGGTAVLASPGAPVPSGIGYGPPQPVPCPSASPSPSPLSCTVGPGQGSCDVWAVSGGGNLVYPAVVTWTEVITYSTCNLNGECTWSSGVYGATTNVRGSVNGGAPGLLGTWNVGSPFTNARSVTVGVGDYWTPPLGSELNVNWATGTQAWSASSTSWITLTLTNVQVSGVASPAPSASASAGPTCYAVDPTTFTIVAAPCGSPAPGGSPAPYPSGAPGSVVVQGLSDLPGAIASALFGGLGGALKAALVPGPGTASAVASFQAQVGGKAPFGYVSQVGTAIGNAVGSGAAGGQVANLTFSYPVWSPSGTHDMTLTLPNPASFYPGWFRPALGLIAYALGAFVLFRVIVGSVQP